jgi:hypothetical protein
VLLHEGPGPGLGQGRRTKGLDEPTPRRVRKAGERRLDVDVRRLLVDAHADEDAAAVVAVTATAVESAKAATRQGSRAKMARISRKTTAATTAAGTQPKSASKKPRRTVRRGVTTCPSTT